MTDASRGRSHSVRTSSIANRIPLGSNLLLATRAPATRSWSRRATLSASDRVQVTRFRQCERPCGSGVASWMKSYKHLGGCIGVSRTRTTAPQRRGATASSLNRCRTTCAQWTQLSNRNTLAPSECRGGSGCLDTEVVLMSGALRVWHRCRVIHGGGGGGRSGGACDVPADRRGGQLCRRAARAGRHEGRGTIYKGQHALDAALACEPCDRQRHADRDRPAKPWARVAGHHHGLRHHGEAPSNEGCGRVLEEIAQALAPVGYPQ